MRQGLHTHIAYYLSLIAVLALGLILIAITKNNPQVQMVAIVMTGFLYALWGIAHHALHHDIAAKVVVEYVLIAAIGITLGLLVVRF